MKNRSSKLSLVFCLIVTLVLAIVPMFALTASAEEVRATLSFASTANRTSFSTSQQVWEQSGITFTNDKASSTSNVADYSNPVRLYAKSSITIEAPGNITGIEFTCSSSAYATALEGSITGATASGSAVTVTPASTSNTFTVASLTAQTRISSLTVTYEQSAEACQHTNTTETITPATKTEDGLKTVACDDCGAVISRETLPALGCKVTFVVPEGLEAPTVEDTVTVTMPSAVEAPDGNYKKNYTFVGWAKEEIGTPTTETPEMYNPGDKVTLEDDTTFYAVYYYGEIGTGVTKRYEKVTENIEDWSGTYIIVYESANLAYIFNGKDTSNGYVDSSIVDGVITSSTDVDNCQVVIAPMDGGYSIYINSAGKYMSGKSGSNTIIFGDSAVLNEISCVDGVATIKSDNSSIQFNVTSGQMRFRYYKSGSTQKTVSLYKLTESAGTTIYYTTALEMTECQHENTTTETVEATCTKDGSITVTCDACGVEISTETIEALGHSYDEGVVTTDPTCTEKGVKTYTCSECGNSYTEDVAATGHDYKNGTCSVCGEVEPDAPKALRFYIATIRSSGNYWYMTSSLGTASTKRYQAVDSGLTTLPASITEPADGYVFVFEANADGTYYIYAEGVDGDNYLGWSSGNSGILVSKENAKAITVTDNGDGTSKLSFNNNARILALNNTTGNNYFAWYTGSGCINLVLIPVGAASEECEHTETTTETVDATCTEAGSITKTCNKCGEVVSVETIAALGHTAEIREVSLNAGKDLTMLYYVELCEHKDIANYKMVFEMNGVETAVNANGTFVFALEGITPQCMSDNIAAYLYEGEVKVDALEEYSVKAYAEAVLAQAGVSSEMKQLITDLLDYGAAAQEYKDYNTGNLANKDVEGIGTASTAAPSDTDNVTNITDNGNVSDSLYFSAAGVRFDYVNQLYAKFKTTDLTGVTVKINGASAEIVDMGNGVYAVYTDGISALNFDTVYTFELYVDGELYQTLTYSVNSYACAKWESTNAKTQRLAQALYRYGVSAEAYIASLEEN